MNILEENSAIYFRVQSEREQTLGIVRVRCRSIDISNRGTNERKTSGGLLAKCEISLHFCKSGRKTGGLLVKCETSLHFCK